MSKRLLTSHDENALRNVLLSYASDDFLGLWEAVPAIRSVMDDSDDELMAIARAILRSLWEKGSIDFVWGDPQPQMSNKLSENDIERVLSDSREWSGDRPLHGRLVWFITTDDEIEKLGAK